MIEITDEMVEMYLSALYPSWRYFDDGLKAHRRSNAAGDLRAAITAVAPLIAAAEREECAQIADAVQDDHKCHVATRQWAGTIAWNIRARGAP